MKAVLIAANVLGWPVLQLAIARGATRMSSRHFAGDGWLFRVRSREEYVYDNWFAVRKWKRMLPDGEAWVRGSFRKRKLKTRDQDYLRRFVIETRRAEAAHWVMLACWPVFCLWNPLWACLVMAAYAVLANVPCIVVQRYNRERMLKLLPRYRQRSL